MHLGSNIQKRPSGIKFQGCFKVSTDYLLGQENTQIIDLSGLSPEEITALHNLIKAMMHDF